MTQTPSTNNAIQNPPRSLARRLFMGSFILLPIFFSFTGFALDHAFQRSLIASERNNLQSQIYLLLAAAEVEYKSNKIKLWMPDALLEPRFSQIDSGLYGFILNLRPATAPTRTKTLTTSTPQDDIKLLWQSPSALMQITALEPLLKKLAVKKFNPGSFFYAESLSITQSLPIPQSQEDFFLLTEDVIWDSTKGSIPLRFISLHNKTDYQHELDSYREKIWLWLSLATLGLIIFQLLMLHWGLSPLRQLVLDLKAMQQLTPQKSKAKQLDGIYPREIQPLADNLNRVLTREAQQRQRYREGLANLAHSLKTPLAVMQSLLSQTKNNQIQAPQEQLQEQINRMNQVVRHQLQRAVSRHTDNHTKTSIDKTARRLCRALAKVYHDKHLDFDIQIAPELMFHGDSADIMEILGNLLENACKFSQKYIRISAHNSAYHTPHYNPHKNTSNNAENTPEFTPNTTIISIEDDGCGIDENLRQEVLERGQRADSLNPGQGIGLSVAAEIIHDYDGHISIHTSVALGGTDIIIRLPWIQSL